MKHYRYKLLLLQNIFWITILLFSCNNASETTEHTDATDSSQIATDEKVKELDLVKNSVNQLEHLSTTDINASLMEDEAKKIHGLLIANTPSLSITTGNGDDRVIRKYYVVEGDILLDRDELYLYCLERLQNTDTNFVKRRNANKLTVATDLNGTPAVWEPGKVLKYAIQRSSFSSKAQYDTVVKQFTAACSDWMQTCNIKFEYHPEFDKMGDIDLESDTSTSLTFLVRMINAGGSFIAKAFFPNDLPYKRTVLIDPSFFTTRANRVGIFRHELGHVLGWRHEHIWSTDTECPGEPALSGRLGAIPLTQFDPYSVMHYICGEKLKTNDYSLSITTFDKSGAQKVYGPPVTTIAKK